MPKGDEWVSWDDDAPQEAIEEARRRHAIDNIPRHAYGDGRVMKWDWKLVDDKDNDILEVETLEQRIRKLIDEQS